MIGSLYLMVPMFHTSYDMGNSINYGSMYFVLGVCHLVGNSLWPQVDHLRRGVTMHDWVASTNTAWFPK
ncbi:hypothetical protein HKD37_01G001122 [Glycine soja]